MCWGGVWCNLGGIIEYVCVTVVERYVWRRAYVSVWRSVGDIIIDIVVVHYHNTHM